MGQNVPHERSVADRLILDLAQREQDIAETARILHEEVGQLLTALGFQLDGLRHQFGSAQPQLNEGVIEVQDLLERALNEVRALSYRLNPNIVQRSGLRYALDTLIGKLRESSSVTIRFLMDSKVRLPLPAALAIFRITELALDNALRHSGSDLLEVTLQALPNRTRLEIRDNGRGFDREEVRIHPTGLGLLWMEHTAQVAGLELEIESVPGGGTMVRAVHGSDIVRTATTSNQSPAGH